MPDAPVPPQLLPSLRRLARGLTLLFWGLPFTLLACFQTLRGEWLHTGGTLPALIATASLVYGLWEMRSFQPAERGWRQMLDRTLFVAFVNLALAPFLYWFGQQPRQPLFAMATALFGLTALTFLSHLNLLLRRLGALLPDETLRQETRSFTRFNRSLLLVTFCLTVLYLFSLNYRGPIPVVLAWVIVHLQGSALQLLFIVPLVLLPLAMTMALLWKAKDVILTGVFMPRH